MTNDTTRPQVHVPRGGVPQIRHCLLHRNRTDRVQNQAVPVRDLHMCIRRGVAAGNWHRDGSRRRRKRGHEWTTGSDTAGKFLHLFQGKYRFQEIKNFDEIIDDGNMCVEEALHIQRIGIPRNL